MSIEGNFIESSAVALSLRAAALLVLASTVLAGCTSAVESGHNTALDSIDLTAMTDRMAASIAGSPEVQAAIASEGKLRIVVEPVRNEMEAEVLPRGQAEAFTARVRFLLSKHAPDRFTWIMNRDAYYRLRQQELDVPLGPAPDAINPRYALVARFRSLANESSQIRSDAYLCVYELTDLQTRTILWTDKYEVKKTAVKAFLD
jgi:PBP1b-binding outer membrane lipoprotein LpoB